MTSGAERPQWETAGDLGTCAEMGALAAELIVAGDSPVAPAGSEATSSLDEVVASSLEDGGVHAGRVAHVISVLRAARRTSQ